MCNILNYAGLILLYLLPLSTTQITGNIQDNYIGCFYNDVNDQSLIRKIIFQNNTILTIELCISRCLVRDSTYAGLENSTTCLCRDNFGVMARDALCNARCPGNQKQYCGGSNGTRAFHSLFLVCEVGYYDSLCGQECHCKRQTPCSRITGQCPDGCEEKWFGKTCSNILLSEKYIGCFRDNETRDISREYYYSGRQTVDACSRSCILQKKSIVGLQAGGHCFCGENYGKYGPISESACFDRCPGNPSEKCGGAWANSVYSLCLAGYYGPKCLKQCNCYNNSRCVYLTGECNSACRPGWTGKSCNIRDCRINNGDCEYYEICESVDIGFANLSMCRCHGGSNGDSSMCRRAHLHYVGCYKGNTTKTASVELLANDSSTTESCLLKCKQLNYTYALIQYNKVCFCGNSYDRYGQLSESSCNMKCNSAENQFCGEGYANSVYEVNDIIWCSSDDDCKPNESCNVLDWKHMNASRCRCKDGFHRMTMWELCTDIDECEAGTSTCNPTSEYCVNSIGSYECECKDGFADVSGICDDIDECRNDSHSCYTETELCINTIGSFMCHCKHGYENTIQANYTALLSCSSNRSTGIILGTLLTISLLINAFFVVSRIKCTKVRYSRCPEPDIAMTWGEDEPCSTQVSGQREVNFGEIPDRVCEENVYQQLQERRTNPSLEYGELKQDD